MIKRNCKSENIKVFDLFSGCGGFRLACEMAGMDIIAGCEIDRYAVLFYKNAFNTENEVFLNDATKIDTGNLPDFDLLVAGFPCQPFSIAGKRQGFNDTRGSLFFEIVRILSDKRPRYFILENVKGLLNHERGKTFQAILESLSDLGIYTIEWAVLNSKYFGVPQNRERVFIVGYPRKFGIGKIFPLRKTTGVHNKSISYKKEICNVASALKARDYASWTGNFVTTFESCNYTGDTLLIKSNTIKGYENLNDGDSINLTFPNSKTRRGRVGKQCSQTLQTSGNIATYYKTQIRRLTPLECFRLQGFPDEIFIKGAYYLPEETLEIKSKYPDKYNSSMQKDEVQDFGNGEQIQRISDTQLYKLAGNSVTVNVVYEIAKKIREVEND